VTTATDVVVVGGGVAGFSTAINVALRGVSVILLDKGDECGGTSRKASAGMMVPNNRHLRDAGGTDPKPDFLRFLTRIGRPLLFDDNHPTLGLPQWEYDLIEAYYDHASDAFEYLAEHNALQTVHQPAWSSYNEVPEDGARFGRLVFAQRPDGSVGDGKEFLRQVTEAALAAGVEIRTRTRVVDVVLGSQCEVRGVSGVDASGPLEITARKGVVFASGGFTHNPDLRREYLNGMYVGGCAALTSEGDFVPIAKSLGAPLINMHACWGAPVVYEQALARDPALISSFTTPGDSILAVNKYGRRVGNEKATYNDRTQTHFAWDPFRAEYPNFLMFPVWDDRNSRLFARVVKPGMESAGNFIPQPDGDWRYVLRGETIESLAAVIAERLRLLRADTHGIELAPDFASTLRSSIEDFNAMARTGVDAAFRRGQTAIERHMHGPAAVDNHSSNPTMFPLAGEGPYYCTILAPGAIDTKGGPKVNVNMQVLDARDEPIPGLYGVGNCVASPSGQAYWSGGSTFGPYITYGYLAARHLVGERR